MAIFVPLSGAPRPPGWPPRPAAGTVRSSLRGPSGGFTLLELATVLLVLGVALAAVLPSARRHGDRAAARAAREAVVGMVARTRAEAMAHGGAVLEIAPGGDSLRVEAGGRVVGVLDLSRDFGADLGPDDAGAAALRFDALGLGRAASRTVTVRRGEAAYALTVSAYGRVKRW